MLIFVCVSVPCMFDREVNTAVETKCTVGVDITLALRTGHHDNCILRARAELELAVADVLVIWRSRNCNFLARARAQRWSDPHSRARPMISLSGTESDTASCGVVDPAAGTASPTAGTDAGC